MVSQPAMEGAVGDAPEKQLGGGSGAVVDAPEQLGGGCGAVVDAPEKEHVGGSGAVGDAAEKKVWGGSGLVGGDGAIGGVDGDGGSGALGGAGLGVDAPGHGDAHPATGAVVKSPHQKEEEEEVLEPNQEEVAPVQQAPVVEEEVNVLPDDVVDPYVVDPYQVVNSDDESLVSYNSDDSSMTVDKTTYASFTRKEEDKLWARGTDAYLRQDETYFCPWHTRKPIDGPRDGLVQHARALGRKDSTPRSQGKHAALFKVLQPGDEL